MDTPQEQSPQNAGKLKRKRVPHTASSPAPSESAASNGTTPVPELLTSRADLSSRPQLSISRGPLFTSISEGSEYCKTDLVGVNRVGYRYGPAGINPPGSAQPCRTIETAPTSYRISWEDRSPFVHVTRDGLGLLGTTGFRSARCNAPIREGRWYMEVKIVRGGGEHATDDTRREGSHVRLGWGRREAPLNGPVGLDGYSYGYRDKTGDKVTLSRPRPYGRPFSTGDVIGMYISLPPCRRANHKDPFDPAHRKRERIAIDFKGQELFESLEYRASKEMTSLMDYTGKAASSAPLPSTLTKKTPTSKLPSRTKTGSHKTNTSSLQPLPTLKNSCIAFFLNGECQGAAFRDIYDYLQLRNPDAARKGKEKKRTREGVKEHRENPFDDYTLGYYPFISLFNDACVRLNPGPNFEFPPPDDIETLLTGEESKPISQGPNWRPICERYEEFMVDLWQLDATDEAEAKVAAQNAAQEKAEVERKAQQKTKKRRLNEAKKQPPKLSEHTFKDEDRTLAMSPNMLTTGQPSPLRHATAYEMQGSDNIERSPAPPSLADDLEFGESELGDVMEYKEEHQEDMILEHTGLTQSYHESTSMEQDRL